MDTETKPVENQQDLEQLAQQDVAVIADMLTSTAGPEISDGAMDPREQYERVKDTETTFSHSKQAIEDEWFERIKQGEDLSASHNAIQDHIEDGTLSELGVDISDDDMAEVIRAVIHGKPPLEIDAVRLTMSGGPNNPDNPTNHEAHLSAEEQLGIKVAQLFRGLTADSPNARVITTIENHESANGVTQETDDRQVVETAELLGDTGAINPEDDAGEDFKIIGQEQQIDQLGSLADQLASSEKGQLKHTEDGTILFFPNASTLSSLGLENTPEGASILRDGIVIGGGDGSEDVALRTCSILAASRPDALYVSVVTSEDASEYNQSLLLLSALGYNLDRFKSIEIDTSKVDPLVATTAIGRVLNKELIVAKKDAEFDLIVAEGLDAPNIEAKEYAARIVLSRFDRLSPEKAIEFLPTLIETMPTTNDEQINTFCDQIADVFGEDIVDNPAFEELWENPKFLKIIGTGHVESISQIRELMKKGEQVQEPSKARKRMWGKFFESLGIDERQKNDIRASWQAIRDEKGDLATPKRDIKVMTELFAERPDALSSLYKHFGIRNFGRYGSKLLLEQLDDLEQGKLADYLTLVISARDDWNGSMDHFPRTLSRNEDMTTPDDVSEQMLFVEAATPTEMLRRLVSISRKFKAVDRLVVSGHGYKHGIQFSSNDELTSEMVESSIAATRLIDRGIINPNIEIILKSCSVGKEGGIAQTISRKLGVHVTAAPENVSQTSSVERKMIDKVLRRKNPRRGTHYLQWESDGKPIRANQYHAGEKQRDVRRIRF